AHHELQNRAIHWHRHLDSCNGALEAVEVLALVGQAGVDDATNFVDGICKLQSAIFDVNARLIVPDKTTIHIGHSSAGRTRDPAVRSQRWRAGLADGSARLHAMYASRPLAGAPTPSDFSFRCSADRSMPIKAAVREML